MGALEVRENNSKYNLVWLSGQQKYFQTAPISLLSLEPSMVLGIYVVCIKSLSKLLQHFTTNHLDVTLYNTVVSYLGSQKFNFSTLPSK